MHEEHEEQELEKSTDEAPEPDQQTDDSTLDDGSTPPEAPQVEEQLTEVTEEPAKVEDLDEVPQVGAEPTSGQTDTVESD